MFHNYQNIRSYLFGLLLAGSLAAAFLGCDKLVPAKFKSQTFGAPDVDQRAAYLMTRDTINDDEGYTVYYQYIPGPPVRHDTVRWSLIHARTIDTLGGPQDITDNQVIHNAFSTLTGSLDALEEDTLMFIKYPGDTAKTTADKAPGDTISVCYALLKCPQAENIYIYTSLEYYYDDANSVSNLGDYVSVDLVRQDTSLVGSSTSVPSAGTYASVLKILASNSTSIVPVLTARYGFQLDAGNYIVRFTLSNPAQISNPQKLPPKGDVVHRPVANEFKVVVLPQ